MSNVRVVVTEKKHPEDLPDEFYFSSPKAYGGSAAVGNAVVIEQEQSRAILARGVIVQGGIPYEECRTVKVIQRFR